MRVIVITGGIGSGKSLVSGMLAQRGIQVYDCDSRVKALYDARPELKALVTSDLFSNAEALKTLEDALFPALMTDFRAWAQAQGSDFVGMESATILSKPFFDSFGDYVMYVDAPQELRLERALSRGGISRESILQRMALQGDYSSDERVSVVICNDSDIQSLEKQIDNFLKTI